MYFETEKFNISSFLSFLSKINLLYRLNDYFSIKQHINETINEFEKNSNNFQKETFDYSKEQMVFFNSTLVMFKSKKTKETKTLVSEYFDKLLIIKALNPILYKTLDLKLNEFFNKYKDVKFQDLDDEQKMLKDDDLINLNVNLFKNIITLPKHYNNFFLVVLDGIYKELYVLNKEKQNLLLYPDKLTSLYYKLRLLKITTDYENDLWLSLNFYLEEQVPSNKLNTIMAYPVALLNKIEKELSNRNYSNIKKSSFYKVFELIPPAKFEKYKIRVGSVISNKELTSEEPEEYKFNFMMNRLKDMLFSAKMILFQDYHYNINYFIEDYYISFIKNYYRFFNCLLKE